MSADDSAHIHIRQFLAQQRRERYRAFVIHGPPLSSKTRLARTLAETTPGGHYLDMLQYIIERPELAQTIDCFNVSALRDSVIAHATTTRASVLFVDEIDFLLHIWGSDLTEFQHMVRTLSVTQTQTVIGFILQTRPGLEEWNEPNTIHQNRILAIENIAAL